jgi:hypothetical protein
MGNSTFTCACTNVCTLWSGKFWHRQTLQNRKIGNHPDKNYENGRERPLNLGFQPPKLFFGVAPARLGVAINAEILAFDGNRKRRPAAAGMLGREETSSVRGYAHQFHPFLCTRPFCNSSCPADFEGGCRSHYEVALRRDFGVVWLAIL